MAVAILALPEFEIAIIDLLTKVALGGAVYGLCALALNIADCRSLLCGLLPNRQEAEA